MDGKLIGAVGGGFFLMVSNNTKKSLLFLKKNKINYTNFKFSYGGSRIENSY